MPSFYLHSNEAILQEGFLSKSIDLAPERVQKRRPLSQITRGNVTPKHREIDWKGETKECSALQVCGNKIIVGWDSGQIKIYSSDDLVCQGVLNGCMDRARVTCLQCICTEIIAGYDDGSICVWNVQTGVHFQAFSCIFRCINRRAGLIFREKWSR